VDNKNWITSLAEKKPSPALVAGMIVVIMTLASVVGVQYYASEKIRSGYDLREIKKDLDHKKDLKEKDSLIAVIQTKLDGCATMIVQRTDDFFKQQRQEYLDRINEQKAIEAKRSKLFAERTTLLKKNANKINTLENVTNQTDEN